MTALTKTADISNFVEMVGKVKDEEAERQMMKMKENNYNIQGSSCSFRRHVRGFHCVSRDLLAIVTELRKIREWLHTIESSVQNTRCSHMTASTGVLYPELKTAPGPVRFR